MSMHEEAPFARLRGGLSIFIFIGLSLSLLVGMGPNLSSRLVSLGEMVWPSYAKDLRTDPKPPECKLEELQQRIEQCPVAQPSTGNSGDPFGDKDPFAEESKKKDVDPFGDKDPFAEESKKKDVDPFGDKDPFAEEPKKKDVDPFADKDPFAEEPKKKDVDPFADKDPFANTDNQKEEVNCRALQNLTERCAVRHSEFEQITGKTTTSVRMYRSVEVTLAKLAKFSYWKHLLVILTLMGAFCVTAARTHIALRDARSTTEYRLSQIVQLIVHLFWMISCWNDYTIQSNSSATPEHLGIPIIWAIGFCLLSFINVFHLIKAPNFETHKNTIGRFLMVIPLYVYMGLLAAAWFTFGENHSSGQAIYLHKFTQHPTIYLGIGLYIWAGMLFATTRIARISFGLLTPWGFPIGILAWLTVVLAAVPTAYSGASGIFVIAAGAVIFEQLRSAGASKRTALAATAMSGSLGVVLRPCLVVVLVAVLNKQVTTDELFSKGLWVFALTAVLLIIAFLWRNTEPLKMNPVADARARTWEAFMKLMPYILLAVLMIAIYGFVLDTWINEHTAPLILPGVLLVMVIVERLYMRKSFPDEPDQRKLWPTVVSATTESSTHIGALLMVMAASVGLGGVVERAELMSYFPDDFGGPVAAMSALVFIMVLVGMTMDALGAVVLVSVTLAKVAYDNGIDPVHFWMMVLVAFELGYLTPPVAMNHLLARQVIGPEASVEDDGVEGFWANTEHIWLPMLVMGVALVIVAFVPFYWY
jgi:TRAP-type C4-dicarboxylate transport system permease large subunit